MRDWFVRMLCQVHCHANRHASQLFLLGLIALIWGNWRQWQRDRTQLGKKCEPDPLLPLARWPELPMVSVLVAAWNEAEHVEQHMQSVLGLSYPHKELILCAGGEDHTYELAESYAGKQVVVLKQRPQEGKQRALQRCLQHARGTVIVLTDADCVISEHAFLRLIFPIVQGDAEVTTGVSEPLPQQRQHALVQYQWFKDSLWSWHWPPAVSGVLGRNCALSRQALMAAGSFSAAVLTGTDYFLSCQLSTHGYTIRAVPQSRIMTAYPANWQAYLRMWRRWNKNLLLHGFKFGAWHDLKGITVSTFVALAVHLFPLAGLWSGPLLPASALFLFAFACGNRLRAIALGPRLTSISVSWLLPARSIFYVWLDMAAVLLSVYDALHPRMRGRW